MASKSTLEPPTADLLPPRTAASTPSSLLPAPPYSGTYAQTLTILAASGKDFINANDLAALRKMQAAIDLWDSRFLPTDRTDPEAQNMKARSEFLENPHAPEAWQTLHGIAASNHAENLRAQFINETLGYAKKDFALKIVSPAIVPVFESILQILTDARHAAVQGERVYAEHLGVQYQESATIQALDGSMAKIGTRIIQYQRGDSFASPRNALSSFLTL